MIRYPGRVTRSARTRTRRARARARALPAALAGLLIALGAAGEARACKPWSPDSTNVVGPIVPGAELAIIGRYLALRCDEGDAPHPGWRPPPLRCALEARFEVRNEGPPIAGRGLVVVSGDDVEVREGGARIDAPASAEEREGWVTDAVLGAGRAYPRADESVRTFPVTLAPGASAVWTIHAEVVLAHGVNGCAEPPIFARHPERFVGDSFTRLIISPLANDDALLEVELDLPRAYGADPEWSSSVERPVRRTRAGRGRRRQRYRLRESGIHDVVSISRDVTFVRGGPIVAAGVDLGAGPRPRLRAGWELATLRRWWIQSLAVESDLKALTLVPTSEVATRVHMALLPSLGVGLGLPIRVYPEARAGVRTQLSLGWRWVSVIGALDVYPLRGREDELRGAIMVQVGL